MNPILVKLKMNRHLAYKHKSPIPLPSLEVGIPASRERMDKIIDDNAVNERVKARNAMFRSFRPFQLMHNWVFWYDRYVFLVSLLSLDLELTANSKIFATVPRKRVQ